MVKCLWCLKELGIFGMLFHKAVCLEYLYSKSLDKLKQAKLTRLITKDQYLIEKRSLREYFMSRFKPKVYEAFIKRQKEQQYIVINPNDLSVGLESDIEMISKKVCIESQEISQKSQFLQSFQNQIEPEYNYITNNYSGNLEVQPMYLTNQFLNEDDNHNNNQVHYNQQDEMSSYQLEIHNIVNIHQQYDNSQDQLVQIPFKQEPILQQSQEDSNQGIDNATPQSNEEQKENILFKLLQKKVEQKTQKEFKQDISKIQNKKQTQTRSKSRKIKSDSKDFESKRETNKTITQQEEIATEIKQISNNNNPKKNPPKFSKSSEKINPKIHQSIENSSIKEPKKRQKRNEKLIQSKSNNEILTNIKQKNPQDYEKDKPQQREMIRTRFQASSEQIQQNVKLYGIKTRDQQKIRQK